MNGRSPIAMETMSDKWLQMGYWSSTARYHCNLSEIIDPSFITNHWMQDVSFQNVTVCIQAREDIPLASSDFPGSSVSMVPTLNPHGVLIIVLCEVYDYASVSNNYQKVTPLEQSDRELRQSDETYCAFNVSISTAIIPIIRFQTWKF